LVVHIDNITWVRDGSYILKDITWHVHQGEHWAVIGLNGSGKTALLKMVAGYTQPSKGEISVLGKKFGSYDLRELRKSIGWVSSSLQERLHANETAMDIVLSGKFATIGLYNKAEAEAQEKALFILDQLDCADFAKRSYATLSQGERQKVLIARALFNSPELIIFDEPCTGLDIFAREQLLSTIEKMSLDKLAPTLLYVSHHIEEILPTFSHTLLLRKGSVYSAGKTKDMLTGDNLSSFFEAPVNVQWQGGRPQMSIAGAAALQLTGL